MTACVRAANYCTVWTVKSSHSSFAETSKLADQSISPKPTSSQPLSSRAKILKAASELVAECGPAAMSLEAVAARAGLSKGGLLYNFSSKAKLLEAIVEEHLDEFKTRLDHEAAQRVNSPNALCSAFLLLTRCDESVKKGPPAGLLAAMAENPDFLEPVRRFNRQLVERLAIESRDLELALIALLAIEGLRLSQLIGTDILSETDKEAVLQRLERMLDGEA